MIRVKLTTEHPQWPWLRQTPGSTGRWHDVQFYVNQDVQECDFWVVYDGLLNGESARCSADNTLLVTAEAPSIRCYSKSFLSQFTTVISCHRGLEHPNVVHGQGANPWFVQKSYDELMVEPPPEKTRLLSIISSSKQFTDGHRKRHAFALLAKDRLGDAIDLFGRGIRDFDNKWDALAPYKYAIALENLSHPDWLTEKLPDCFLGWTFPFYWGCPNVKTYFNGSSLFEIDIDNPERSIRQLLDVTSDPNHYAAHVEVMRHSRLRYLNELQLFAMLGRLVPTLLRESCKRTTIVLRPDTPKATGRIERASRALLRRVKRVLRGK